jgi:hypothetical protein
MPGELESGPADQVALGDVEGDRVEVAVDQHRGDASIRRDAVQRHVGRLIELRRATVLASLHEPVHVLRQDTELVLQRATYPRSGGLVVLGHADAPALELAGLSIPASRRTRMPVWSITPEPLFKSMNISDPELVRRLLGEDSSTIKPGGGASIRKDLSGPTNIEFEASAGHPDYQPKMRGAPNTGSGVNQGLFDTAASGR